MTGAFIGGKIIMEKSLSRRSMLSATGRVAVATLGLGGVSVAATTGEDAELHRLWAEYQQRKAVYDAAHEAHSGLRRQIAAEHGVDEDARIYNERWSGVLRSLYDDETPLCRLADAWNAADRSLLEAAKAIRAAPAEGLFGVGVKLMAVHNNDLYAGPEDWLITIGSALKSINALVGSDFDLGMEEDDDAEDDADV